MLLIQLITPVGMARRRVCLVEKPREATIIELNVVRPELGTFNNRLIRKNRNNFGSVKASTT